MQRISISLIACLSASPAFGLTVGDAVPGHVITIQSAPFGTVSDILAAVTPDRITISTAAAALPATPPREPPSITSSVTPGVEPPSSSLPPPPTPQPNAGVETPEEPQAAESAHEAAPARPVVEPPTITWDPIITSLQQAIGGILPALRSDPYVTTEAAHDALPQDGPLATHTPAALQPLEIDSTTTPPAPPYHASALDPGETDDDHLWLLLALFLLSLIIGSALDRALSPTHHYPTKK